jgi:hypothetical protein
MAWPGFRASRLWHTSSLDLHSLVADALNLNNRQCNAPPALAFSHQLHLTSSRIGRRANNARDWDRGDPASPSNGANHRKTVGYVGQAAIPPGAERLALSPFRPFAVSLLFRVWNFYFNEFTQ